jgi:hypothetical protein
MSEDEAAARPGKSDDLHAIALPLQTIGGVAIWLWIPVTLGMLAIGAVCGPATWPASTRSASRSSA